jgi:hypothetical protein
MAARTHAGAHARSFEARAREWAGACVLARARDVVCDDDKLARSVLLPQHRVCATCIDNTEEGAGWPSVASRTRGEAHASIARIEGGRTSTAATWRMGRHHVVAWGMGGEQRAGII